jgi:hypothetical protein
MDRLNRDLDFSLKRRAAGGEPGSRSSRLATTCCGHPLPMPQPVVVSPSNWPLETETETETETERPVSLVSHSLLALLELFVRKCLIINTTHSI